MFNRTLTVAKKVASKNVFRQQIRTMADHHATDVSILYRRKATFFSFFPVTVPCFAAFMYFYVSDFFLDIAYPDGYKELVDEVKAGKRNPDLSLRD